MDNEQTTTEQSYKIREGMHGRTVSHHSQIPDDAVVQVDGMELKASMAREMGLLQPRVLDAQLGDTPETPKVTLTEQPEEPTGTGHEGYDQSVSEISAKVEEGVLTEGEAQSFELALGEIALSGMTVTDVTNAIDGVTDISQMDINQRNIVTNVQAQVTQAATESAMNELGQVQFDRLRQLATASSEVDRALVQYVSMRALGKTSDSWTVFLAMAEEELAGR